MKCKVTAYLLLLVSGCINLRSDVCASVENSAARNPDAVVAGFQIGIHAIGDEANHWILNAYEKAHLTAMPPEQIMSAKVDYTIVGGRIVYRRPRD